LKLKKKMENSNSEFGSYNDKNKEVINVELA
jgi:hypothetical protein